MPRVFYNPDLKSRWFYVPAVLAMILMVMTMLLSAMGVVREKEIGTMEQLIVTPIRPWQLLVGKLLPFALIGLFQMCVATAVTVFGFGVPLRGSFALLLGLTALFILSTLGLGLFVSTLVQNQQQAMMGAVFAAMVPMIYLSGLIFPIENMPPAIQLVTYVIPLRYYAEIIRGVFLRGSGIDVLWREAVGAPRHGRRHPDRRLAALPEEAGLEPREAARLDRAPCPVLYCRVCATSRYPGPGSPSFSRPSCSSRVPSGPSRCPASPARRPPGHPPGARRPPRRRSRSRRPPTRRAPPPAPCSTWPRARATSRAAARYLQLSPDEQARGAELARKLRAVLERHLDIDIDALSPLAEGNLQDGLPPGVDTVGSVPDGHGGEDPVFLVRTRDAAGYYWAFSRQTVSRIDGWYDALPDRWVRDWMPERLQRQGPADLLWWQWLALPALLVLVARPRSDPGRPRPAPSSTGCSGARRPSGTSGSSSGPRRP